MDAVSERRGRTPDTAQDLASKYARAKAMLREQIDSNQALRLALREEQRQRTTLADGLSAERAATMAAVRKVAELEDLLAQQRAASLAARQVDAQTQATLEQPAALHSSDQHGQQAAGTGGAPDAAVAAAAAGGSGHAAAESAAQAAEAAKRQAQADAAAALEAAKQQAQADAEAAVEAVSKQSQAAQQRLCAQMLAALRQLQSEAQELAVQTKLVAQQQSGRNAQRSMAVA